MYRMLKFKRASWGGRGRLASASQAIVSGVSPPPAVPGKKLEMSIPADVQIVGAKI